MARLFLNGDERPRSGIFRKSSVSGVRSRETTCKTPKFSRYWDSTTHKLSREKARKPHSLLWGGMESGGFGGGSPHYGFFLGISPGHIGTDKLTK